MYAPGIEPQLVECTFNPVRVDGKIGLKNHILFGASSRDTGDRMKTAAGECLKADGERRLEVRAAIAASVSAKDALPVAAKIEERKAQLANVESDLAASRDRCQADREAINEAIEAGTDPARAQKALADRLTTVQRQEAYRDQLKGTVDELMAAFQRERVAAALNVIAELERSSTDAIKAIDDEVKAFLLALAPRLAAVAAARSELRSARIEYRQLASDPSAGEDFQKADQHLTVGQLGVRLGLPYSVMRRAMVEELIHPDSRMGRWHVFFESSLPGIKAALEAAGVLKPAEPAGV